jgi:hypothetical protein
VLSSFDEGVTREVREVMDTQTGQGEEGPRIYVGPERNHFGAEYADDFVEAVERGGGVVVDEPGEPKRSCGSARITPGCPSSSTLECAGCSCPPPGWSPGWRRGL